MLLRNKLQSFNLSRDLTQEKQWGNSPYSHTDLPRLRKGLVSAQFWSVYVPCEAQYMNTVQLLLEQIDAIKRLLAASPKETTLVMASTDIMKEFGCGRVSSLLGVEGGHGLGNSMGVLRALYDLGVRYVTLTHKCHTPWAECSEDDSGEGPNAHGLTIYGKKMIVEMNRLGMMVDLSHSSANTARDVLATSLAPVIFSHSAARALCDIDRNVPDDILSALADNGGLVMVSFYSDFLTCGKPAAISDVIAHINHVRTMAGVDHVGLGAGYDGVNKTPQGLEDVSRYPELFAELLQDPSWSLKDLKKLAGLNLLRVFGRSRSLLPEDLMPPPPFPPGAGPDGGRRALRGHHSHPRHRLPLALQVQVRQPGGRGSNVTLPVLRGRRPPSSLSSANPDQSGDHPEDSPSSFFNGQSAGSTRQAILCSELTQQ
ncbi:Dipeptidase 1 [Penaeus vannamei]|uniref:Dipeptidase n=1 Tax=Penaeus vannamei TaxID=6689 RepID=A0A3R7T167_PENVA|nr:Dipeptidase 1 [Penaeus vannamei]